MSGLSDTESISGWFIERHVGSTQALHDSEPDFARRLVRVNQIESPSLVLGSTQSRDLIDVALCEARGVEVAQRHSGGGVVSMQPGAQCWIDVFIPADDPLWVDDVTHSALWLGECWARVASAYGWNESTVHTGAISDPVLSRLVCFAALGAGELSQGSTKLVGVSQRRTRHGAKFQCIAYLDWDPAPILEIVDLGPLAAEVETALVDGVAALAGGPRASHDSRADGSGTTGHSRAVGPGTRHDSRAHGPGKESDTRVDQSAPGWSVVECLLAELP